MITVMITIIAETKKGGTHGEIFETKGNNN